MLLGLDMALAVIVILAICLLGAVRLGSIIRLFVFQSFVMATIPLMLGGEVHIHKLVIVLGTVVLKVIFIPTMLFWAVRHVSIRRYAPGFFGIGANLLLGGF